MSRGSAVTAPPRLPVAWLARSSVQWARAAWREGNDELAKALLTVTSEAIDVHLRHDRTCPVCRHEHDRGTECCTICAYHSRRPAA